MSVSTSNRDVDVETPAEFIEGMDIEVPSLESSEWPILQHRQRHDSEFWNLRWTASGGTTQTRYGAEGDPDFTHALYNSLKALKIDDSLDQSIDLTVSDGENFATYHCGMENFYEGVNFDINGAEMLKRISSSGNQSRIDHESIEYFELDTDGRKFIWEKEGGTNHYGILGTNSADKADISLLYSSLTSEKRGKIDFSKVRQQLQTETAEYQPRIE